MSAHFVLTERALKTFFQSELRWVAMQFLAPVAIVVVLALALPSSEAASSSDDVNGGTEPRAGRQKRFYYLWCMNFPDCCNLFGRGDRCGLACPVCPKTCEEKLNAILFRLRIVKFCRFCRLAP